jgi:cytochrome c553
MKSVWSLATLISSIAICTTAWAAGNAEQGQAKAAVCAACHGLTGNSVNPEWPSLAGLGAGYIAEQVKNFIQGKRQNPVMMPMVANLNDQDIADIAAFFGAQRNTGLEADPSFWKAGERLYRGGNKEKGVPACMACHGPLGRGGAAAKFPALRGQQSVYTVKQLNDYASGVRKTGPNGIMQTISQRLSADDMRNVASYVQGLR